MRHYPEDKSDLREAEKLGAEPWMLDQLKLNPGYVSWGPYEDYMSDDDKGWASRCIIDSWADFDFGLDDLNEVVNFYFEINRNSEECASCGGSGYNPATKAISDDWYDFAGTGRRWCNKITDHEVNALWEQGRLKHDFKEKPTAEQVNAWNSGKTLGHDAINKWICVQARAEREGVYGMCETCGGDGRVFTEPNAHLGLVLWVLHPRKGCSRGVHVKHIEQSELPAVFEYLSEAAKRNAERFEKITRKQS